MKELQNISKYKSLIIDYTEEKFKANNINYSLSEDISGSREDEVFSSIIGKNFAKKFSNFMSFDTKYKDAKALEALDSLNYEKTRWNVYYYKKAQDINKL